MGKYFHEDLPIILGLNGEAATGKTVSANALAPKSRIVDPQSTDIYWENLFFALPLYQIARARQSIEGEKAFDRMCYEIHDTLVDVFGRSPLYGAPAYDELVEMVWEIASYPCPAEGKPRSFLQYVGTEVCRAYDPDCWVKWMARKVAEEHRRFQSEIAKHNDTDDPNHEEVSPPFGVVISDCRFLNEARWISEHPNGILIKLWARPEVVQTRLLERDGFVLTTQQQNHASELEVNMIPRDWFTQIIDTSDMTVAEQVAAVKETVQELFHG